MTAYPVAPEGYRWAQEHEPFPLVCASCGCNVTDVTTHDLFHATILKQKDFEMRMYQHINNGHIAEGGR